MGSGKFFPLYTYFFSCVPTNQAVLCSLGKSGKISLFPAGWKPLTHMADCSFQEALTCTHASRCLIGEWDQLMTSSKALEQQWLGAPPWSVSQLVTPPGMLSRTIGLCFLVEQPVIEIHLLDGIKNQNSCVNNKTFTSIFYTCINNQSNNN